MSIRGYQNNLKFLIKWGLYKIPKILIKITRQGDLLFFILKTILHSLSVVSLAFWYFSFYLIWEILPFQYTFTKMLSIQNFRFRWNCFCFFSFQVMYNLLVVSIKTSPIHCVLLFYFFKFYFWLFHYTFNLVSFFRS